MIHNRKISICAPMLNEAFFLPIYLNGIRYLADQLVLTDGGSRDDSIDIIDRFSYTYPHIECSIAVEQQQGMPYSDDWNEGSVRNKLLDRCTGDYIFILDIDEVIDIADAVSTVLLMEQSASVTLASFRLIPFWGDLHHIRCSTQDDNRWYGVNLARVLKKGMWKFDDTPHHCALQHKDFGRTAIAMSQNINTGLPVYHLHYGFGEKGVKVRDNRRGDLINGSCGIDVVDEPIFNKQGLNIKNYIGPYPTVLEEYL